MSQQAAVDPSVITPVFAPLGSQLPTGAPPPAFLPSSQTPSQPRSTYGRNLRGGYASGWQAAQREKEAARIQLRLTEEAIRNSQNTISVVVWREVRSFVTLLMSTLLNSSHPLEKCHSQSDECHQ
jgi:hypothetical protein